MGSFEGPSALEHPLDHGGHAVVGVGRGDLVGGIAHDVDRVAHRDTVPRPLQHLEVFEVYDEAQPDVLARARQMATGVASPS